MVTLSSLLKENNINSLYSYSIVENRMLQEPSVVGYAFEDGAWIVYDIDERWKKTIHQKFSTEEEAIQETFKLIKIFRVLGR